MEYDIESILEMYEDDYNPSSKVPGPRNMYNQGQLVQPNADGSRPGYNGKKKLNPANLRRTQDSLKFFNDKFGKKTLDKISKNKYGVVFSKVGGEKDVKGEFKNLKKRILKFEDFITENNRMPTETEARSIGRQPRIQTEQAIQIKLLEETNKGNFFDAEKFAKTNNISMEELKKEAGRLQNNIYNKRMKLSGKEMRRVLDWIPDDASVSDNALNKLWKSKLIKYERNKIEELFYDAFGREFIKGTKDKNPNFNPKKHLAIRNNLTEYYRLRKAINLKYPNINLALDHPLSKSTLKKIFNATPDQLTRVNPLEADLNNGFKDSLSLQYEKAIQSKNITQKKAVEKIAKDLKLNIGKVNNDATNFKYGVKEFQKLNMKDEILKAVQTQADLSDNFKTYVKNNPELFKTANVNPNTNITKVTQKQVKEIASLLEKLGCGKSAGGRIKFGKGTTCAMKGREVIEKGLKNGFKNKKQQVLAEGILKSGRFLKDAVSLRGLFGPAALGFTIAAEAGLVGYDMLSKGKSFREAVGDSLFNYVVKGTDYEIDPVEERDKRMVAEGMTPEQMGKIKYFESMMNDMQKGFSNYDNIKNLEKKIEENTFNQQVNPEFFSDESFQLNTQLDKAQAENQDYFRTNRVGELENYFTPKEDGTIPFVEGSATLQEGLRRNELAQLQDAGIGKIYQSPRGDKKRSARIRELMLQNPDIRNYMGSYPTNYGFMEGGIASLNVKK